MTRTHPDLPTAADRAPNVASEVHIVPTDDDGPSGIDAHGDEEEGRVLHLHVVMHGEQDREAGDADGDAEHSVGEAVLRVVREHGEEHCETESRGPWGDGVQLRLDGAVAVAVDDAGREVGVCVRWDDEGEIHEARELDFDVPHDRPHVPDGDRAVNCCLALFGFELGGYVGSLVWGQPGGFFGSLMVTVT